MPSSSTTAVPDDLGHFGPYGGVFVPETLIAALDQLKREYAKAKSDPSFQQEFQAYLSDYVGRPSRLYFARRLTEKWKGARIYLKREDLNHTGAHKINNTIGQALLTRRMGKKRHHRRNRRRPARCRHRHRRRPLRPQVRCLHGR